jgi:uncharacterized protein
MSLRLARFCIAVALFALNGSLAVQAQQPTPGAIAAAKELLEIKGASRMFEPVINGVVVTVKNNFLQTNPSLVKDLNEVAAQLQTEFAPRRAEVLNDFASLYAQRFSEQELKETVAFYKTPTGKKFVAEEPLVIDQGLQRAQAWSQKLAEEVLSRMRAEMKKRGHDL